MMDVHYTKDDKEMIVESNMQSTAVLELDQILDIQGPKIPSWENWPICVCLILGPAAPMAQQDEAKLSWLIDSLRITL